MLYKIERTGPIEQPVELAKAMRRLTGRLKPAYDALNSLVETDRAMVHFNCGIDQAREALASFQVCIRQSQMSEAIADVMTHWSGLLAIQPRQEDIETLADYLTPEHNVTSRHQYPLHVTASGIIFDTKDRAVLLVRHTAMKKWLFPGGHLDQDEIMLDAAVRELFEETSLDVSEFNISPFAIDIHTIPANPKKGEPAHWHCDFSYLFSGEVNRADLRLSKESTGFLWADSAPVLVEHCAHWTNRPYIAELVAKLLDEEG